MSSLNDLLGKVLGQSADAKTAIEHRGLLESVIGMAGGLTGLLDGLKQNGLGHAVQSWMGTSSNIPVNGQQIAAALGSQKIQEIAKNLGLSADQAAGGLANLLPQLVDKLTPDGKLPDSASLTQMLGSLKSALRSNATA